MAEEILIDFKVDYTELINAQEQLSKSGKIDAAGFSAINKAITSTANNTSGLIQDFKKVATTATQMGKSVEKAFEDGVMDALNEAGVSVDDFSKALAKANTPAKSLKAELLELKNALAQAKVNGKDTGAEFEALRARAGALQDAIADANTEIKNTGSDTRNIDNLLGSVSAIAGGFAVAQGAVALFGEENEDLQKALLKVNGAMAIAQGLQQVSNALTKEGSLTKLADSIATGTQTAAQRIYAVAIGTSTGALKAFRIALLATGIGAAIVLIIALVEAMKDYGERTDNAAKLTDEFSESIANLNSDLDELQGKISLQGKLQLEALKQRGASEQELHDKEVEFLKYQKEAIQDNNEKRIESTNILLEGIGLFGKGLIKNKKDADELVKSLRLIAASLPEGNEQRKSIDKIIEATEELAINFKDIATIDKDIVIKTEEFKTKTVLDGIKKRDEAEKKRLADAEKNAAKKKAERLAELNDTLAILERDLIAVEKNSQAEINIKKAIVQQKSAIELQNEKLTANQIKLIREKSNDDQLKLQDDFNKKISDAELQGQIDTNTALLAGLNVSNEEKLRLQIENIATASQLEINAAEGNAAKILAIEAKRAADIRAIKLAAIDKERQDQIESNARTNQIVTDALTKLANDSSQSVNIRIAAIRSIERQELTANQNAIDDNERKNKEKLISEEEYQRKKKELIEKGAQISADADQKEIDVTKDANKEKIESLKEYANEVLNVATQVNDFFSQLSALRSEQERNAIEGQKKQVQELLEAHAITEKDAKVRMQQLEIAEKQAKQRAAEREKRSALFTAIINTAAGIAKAIPNIFLMALAAATGAAQIALISSRPVPKFFRGKKDRYEGLGEVADMGSEIVERKGRMFLYTKPTQTYLGATDKVYTASETRNILHNTNVNTTVAPGKQIGIDYEKLAKAMPKQSNVAINIQKDFIEESVANGLSKNRYFNNRYKWQ